MKPFGLTVEWYDNPPFDGGGTTLRIKSGDEVVHFFRYDAIADALKDATKLLSELSSKFVNSDGSDADIQKWKAMVDTKT
jgi:hypothetical protein